MERVFNGQFRIAYLLVKTAALYVGTFLLCEYWPAFLSYVVAPDLVPQMEMLAGALLTPLGFLILGGAQGLRVFLVHFMLLMLAGPIAYLTVPHGADDAVQAMVSRWVLLIFFAYAVGAVYGARQQLKRFGSASSETVGTGAGSEP